MRTASRSSAPLWLPLFCLLLILGAILRLINLNAPPLDFHPTRQLRNALVARAIYYAGLPQADPSTRNLTESFRRAVGQYEPPIFETIVGQTFRVTGGESFAIPRIYDTAFWLVAGVALFSLSRRIASPVAALISLTYFLVLPFAVQASRSFQPDPLMTAAFVIAIYGLFRWTESREWKWAIFGALFAGLAVLVKVVIVFLLIGGAIALVLATLGRRFWRSPQVWAMAALMGLPATGYYVLAQPARSSEYFFAWTVDLIRLITSVHFYADWLGFVGSLVGLTTILLSLIGTCFAPIKTRWLLVGLWAGYLMYGLALPFQMFTHSYYHLQLVPVIALGLLPVAEVLIARARELTRVWQVAMLLPVLALMVYEGWAVRSVLVAEDFSDSPAFWESIGRAIPENADVIALTQDYGFDLMYWGWRRVELWPLNTNLSQFRNSERDLAARFEALTAENRYFLVTAFGQLESQPEVRSMLERYPVAAQGAGYVLYDLQAPQ
jgi:4-amino-4-deoxy-L-arabinose transferase-like glycosyltransferase